MARAPCRRRTGDSVPRAKKFGDLITADHKVLSEGCESRNNHRYSVVVQDLATQWIQSYPRKTKTSQETERSLRKFLEPSEKPKVLYTDNSLEFGKSCEDLSRTKSERRYFSRIATIRLDEKWWADSLLSFAIFEMSKTSWQIGQEQWLNITDFITRAIKTSSIWQDSFTWYLSWV